MKELFSLENRVAIVAGGGQGLGKTYSGGLAELGAVLAIVDVNGEQASQTASDFGARGHCATSITCDVAKELKTAPRWSFPTCSPKAQEYMTAIWAELQK